MRVTHGARCIALPDGADRMLVAFKVSLGVGMSPGTLAEHIETAKNIGARRTRERSRDVPTKNKLTAQNFHGLQRRQSHHRLCQSM